MANAYSIPKARQRWIDPTNQDFALKALMYTQQKYDANQAKVDALIEQYSALQLARGVDKQYLNERLGTLVKSISDAGPQNFSSNAVTASISQHLGQVLDNNVMTAMQETAKIKNYYAEVAAIREKTPEKYNETNEAYGLRNVQAYLNNTELGAKIQGNLTYTAYQDVHGEMNKYLLEIQKSSKDGTIEVPVTEEYTDDEGKIQVRNTGRMRKTTINGLSAQELRDVAYNFMGNRFDNQIRINAWGNSGGFQNMDAIVRNATAQYDALIDVRNKEIAEAEALLTGKASDDDKEAIKLRIRALKNEVISANEMKTTMVQNPEGALTFLEKQKMATSASNALGLLRTESVEYSKDDYYFATIAAQQSAEKLLMDKNQNEINNQFKAEELRLKSLEVQNKLDGTNSDGSSSSSTGGGSGGIDIQTVAEDISAEAGPQESAHNLWKQEISNQYQNFAGFNSEVMNSVMSMAEGRAGTVQQQKEAKALVNKFLSNGGDLSTRTPNNTQKFSRELSRADAYESLRFLDFGNTRRDVKKEFNQMQSEYTRNVNTYRSAKTKAQASQAKLGAQGKSFEEDVEFTETAKRYSSGLNVNNVAVFNVNSKNKGLFNRILSMSDTGKEGAVFEATDDTGVKIKDLRNGKYEVTYQSKGEDGNKDKILVSRTVTINKDALEGAIPKLRGNGTAPKYNLESLKGRPLYSPRIGSVSRGSMNYDDYVDTLTTFSKNPEIDKQLIDLNDAKKYTKNLVNLKQFDKNPQLKAQVENLIDALFSNKAFADIRTSIEYKNGVGTNTGKGYIGVNDVKRGRLFNVSLGNSQNLDYEAELNQYLPQVLYAKTIIEKITEVTSEASRTGKLTISPDLEKLLR